MLKRFPFFVAPSVGRGDPGAPQSLPLEGKVDESKPECACLDFCSGRCCPELPVRQHRGVHLVIFPLHSNNACRGWAPDRPFFVGVACQTGTIIIVPLAQHP